MIGGIVIDTVLLPDRIWVKCEEKNSTSTCAIYVKRNEKSERIKKADTVWWQSGFAMHTPYGNTGKKGGVDFDIKLERIGFSGVERPKL